MKSLAHIIIATMLLITLPSMLYAETAYAEAQAKANATEQSEDLFADIGGTPLNDEQADAIEGDFIEVLAGSIIFLIILQLIKFSAPDGISGGF